MGKGRINLNAKSVRTKISVLVVVGICLSAGAVALHLKGGKMPPTVTNYETYNITTTTATLWADYDAGSWSSMNIRFEYRENSSDTWQYTDWHEVFGSGRWSKTIGGLNPNTCHEFRAIVQYDSSTLTSSAKMFETQAILPTIKFLEVTNVGETSARLNVSYDCGSYPEVDIRFSYKEIGCEGENTEWTTVSGSGTFSENVSNLTPGMVYLAQAITRYDNMLHLSDVGAFQTPHLPGHHAVPNYEAIGNVTAVLDGDTIHVSLTWVDKSAVGVKAGSGEAVRFAGGIDAPEIAEEGGEEAKEFVYNLCPPGTEVLLDLDSASYGPMLYRDLHGRLLSVIYVRRDNAWVNVNAQELRWGLEAYPRNNWLAYIGYGSEFDPYEWLADNYPYVL